MVYGVCDKKYTVLFVCDDKSHNVTLYITMLNPQQTKYLVTVGRVTAYLVTDGRVTTDCLPSD